MNLISAIVPARPRSLHCTHLHQFPTFFSLIQYKNVERNQESKPFFSFIIYFQNKILMKDLINNTYHSWIF